MDQSASFYSNSDLLTKVRSVCMLPVVLKMISDGTHFNSYVLILIRIEKYS